MLNLSEFFTHFSHRMLANSSEQKSFMKEKSVFKIKSTCEDIQMNQDVSS
jgi:hypothetical protein